MEIVMQTRVVVEARTSETKTETETWVAETKTETEASKLGLEAGLETEAGPRNLHPCSPVNKDEKIPESQQNCFI